MLARKACVPNWNRMPAIMPAAMPLGMRSTIFSKLPVMPMAMTSAAAIR